MNRGGCIEYTHFFCTVLELTRQGKPYHIATLTSFGFDAAADMVKVGIVLANNLSAHDILGTLQVVDCILDRRLLGVEHRVQHVGIEGARTVGETDTNEVAIHLGGEMQSIGHGYG